MIACNLIKEVQNGKNHDIDIVLDMNYNQFLEGSAFTECVKRPAC